MAPKQLKKISDESSKVMELIKQRKSFLLSGGAGSGKTYSLVEILNAVMEYSPSSNIGCITYTNAAVDEIESRIFRENLNVSTIHDFLWGNIKQFQTELKETLFEIINDPEDHSIKHPRDEIVDENFFDDCERIQYKEYLKIEKGIISHDQVIVLADKMFKKYDKLCSIIKDKYPFIFVDEYQDTHPLVVSIFLEHLGKSGKNNIVGFFGDSMQSIYEDGVGDLHKYTRAEPPKLEEVFKEQNRRNPLRVIKLANQLRTDGLVQKPSEDVSAPNMRENGEVEQGDIKFLYSFSGGLDLVREYLAWDFEDSSQVKELNLTHSLIADKAKFPELMRIYDKDKVREYIVNKIKKLLERDEPDYDTAGKTLSEVIEHVGSPSPTPTQKDYIGKYNKWFEMAKKQPYDVISKLYVDKDQLLDDKKNYAGDNSRPGSNRDDLIRHLFKIEHLVRLYQSRSFNKFIKAADYPVRSVHDKVKLNDAIQSFVLEEGVTIGEVIDRAHELGLVVKDDSITRFSKERTYLYNQVSEVAYQEFRNVYDYLEGHSPFSTKHKTKGAEFSNVLVILDSGRWNHYNFKNLFEENGTDSVLRRSQKIFYVCCTRAKRKLAVFFPRPNPEVIQKAKSWFGEESVINLDDL